jgi:tartrate dehydratase alpha subunit/fumarate hydratase class I-like protein
MQKKSPGERAAKVSVSMPLDMWKKWKADADRQHRTLSNLITATLIESTKRADEDHPPVCPASGCGTKKGCTLKTA